VLFEMAAGRPAFEGASKASLIAAILERNAPPVSAGRQGATGDAAASPVLDHIVSRCLAKNPDERWQTASDLCQALKWAEANPLQREVPRRASHHGQDYGLM